MLTCLYYRVEELSTSSLENVPNRQFNDFSATFCCGDFRLK